jgi:DNA-directed RNA polymerase subunit RPC12/RpoP
MGILNVIKDNLINKTCPKCGSKNTIKMKKSLPAGASAGAIGISISFITKSEYYEFKCKDCGYIWTDSVEELDKIDITISKK